MIPTLSTLPGALPIVCPRASSVNRPNCLVPPHDPPRQVHDNLRRRINLGPWLI